MKTSDIDLHIDRLVLHGVAPGDRHRIGQAVGDELTRLLTRSGLADALAAGADIDRIDAGAFNLPSTGSGSRPAAVGALIAQTLHRGLAR
jgi:hypothetical protein